MQVVRVQSMHHHLMLSPIRESPLREAVGDDEDPLLLEDPIKASLDFFLVSHRVCIHINMSSRACLFHLMT